MEHSGEDHGTEGDGRCEASAQPPVVTGPLGQDQGRSASYIN